MIATSEDGIITKCDALTHRLVWEGVIVGERQIYWSRVVSTVFSPDRKSVVFGDNQESIWVWDADTRKRDSQPLGVIRNH